MTDGNRYSVAAQIDGVADAASPEHAMNLTHQLIVSDRAVDVRWLTVTVRRDSPEQYWVSVRIDGEVFAASPEHAMNLTHQLIASDRAVRVENLSVTVDTVGQGRLARWRQAEQDLVDARA